MPSVRETAAMLAVTGCYSLFFCGLPPFVRAENYHINARKATMGASKLTSAVKRFKFASKVVEGALSHDF
jgi:hypothetical protein